MILVILDCQLFQHWDSIIGLFSIDPCKVIDLNLFCLILDIIAYAYFLSISFFNFHSSMNECTKPMQKLSKEVKKLE